MLELAGVQLRDVDRVGDQLVAVQVVQVGDHHGAFRREEEDAGVTLAVGVVVLWTVHDDAAATGDATGVVTAIDDVVLGRQL